MHRRLTATSCGRSRNIVFSPDMDVDISAHNKFCTRLYALPPKVIQHYVPEGMVRGVVPGAAKIAGRKQTEGKSPLEDTSSPSCRSRSAAVTPHGTVNSDIVSSSVRPDFDVSVGPGSASPTSPVDLLAPWRRSAVAKRGLSAGGASPLLMSAADDCARSGAMTPGGMSTSHDTSTATVLKSRRLQVLQSASKQFAQARESRASEWALKSTLEDAVVRVNASMWSYRHACEQQRQVVGTSSIGTPTVPRRLQSIASPAAGSPIPSPVLDGAALPDLETDVREQQQQSASLAGGDGAKRGAGLSTSFDNVASVAGADCLRNFFTHMSSPTRLLQRELARCGWSGGVELPATAGKYSTTRTQVPLPSPKRPLWLEAAVSGDYSTDGRGFHSGDVTEAARDAIAAMLDTQQQQQRQQHMGASITSCTTQQGPTTREGGDEGIDWTSSPTRLQKMQREVGDESPLTALGGGETITEEALAQSEEDILQHQNGSTITRRAQDLQDRHAALHTQRTQRRTLDLGGQTDGITLGDDVIRPAASTDQAVPISERALHQVLQLQNKATSCYSAPAVRIHSRALPHMVYDEQETRAQAHMRCMGGVVAAHVKQATAVRHVLAFYEQSVQARQQHARQLMCTTPTDNCTSSASAVEDEAARREISESASVHETDETSYSFSSKRRGTGQRRTAPLTMSHKRRVDPFTLRQEVERNQRVRSEVAATVKHLETLSRSATNQTSSGLSLGDKTATPSGGLRSLTQGDETTSSVLDEEARIAVAEKKQTKSAPSLFPKLGQPLLAPRTRAINAARIAREHQQQAGQYSSLRAQLADNGSSSSTD